MKKLFYILLLFSASCKAQTLTHSVNGVQVPFTATEITLIKAEWAVADSIRKIDSVNTVKQKALQSNIVSTAQTAVGVRVDALTAAQVRALQAILLFKVGAVDTSLKIKALNTWVK